MLFWEGTPEGKDIHKYNMYVSVVTVKTLCGFMRVCFNNLIMT